MTIEHLERDILVQVLPLDDDLREDVAGRFDELVDDREVGIATQPVFPPTEVPRVVEQFLVVGADVEADRQRACRMDAGPDAIQRQLADADRHAADALVPDTQYGLVIGDDHEFDVAERRRVTQDLLDAAGIIGRDEYAARAPVHV